jgi:alpha-N-acetylglucosaminidase
VAFPDVEPFVIQTQGLYMNSVKQYSTIPPKNYDKGTSNDAYDHPHLWYNTSVVVHALELFLRYGDELSDSNTFRLEYKRSNCLVHATKVDLFGCCY